MMLHKALVALKDWVDDGCPEHEVFKPYRSVCVCVENYLEPKCSKDSLRRNMNELSNLMNNRQYPFNDCFGDWSVEWEEESFYQNPKRLEWLAAHGCRTISDCIPLVIPTSGSNFKALMNLFQRNGKVYALPDIWLLMGGLGITKAPRELRENAVDLLAFLGVEIDHAL